MEKQEFWKRQLVASEEFKNVRDVLEAVLQEGRYSREEALEAVHTYLEREVMGGEA